jgi:hypothetical protein
MDIIRWNYPLLLSRSSSKKYKEQITTLTITLMTFLVDNELIKISPFETDGSLKSDLVIRKSHLTSIGNELYIQYFEKWSNYVDRTGNVESTITLENGLKKILPLN